MWLFKLIIFICFLFYLFHVSTKKYLNPYKLIFLFGKKGAGKTTNLTKIAIRHLKAGWKVYSTIEIPGCEIFHVEDIGKRTFPANSCVLIDEVGMIWDNRDFKTFRKDVRDYFKYQRQYKNKVYFFSQTFDEVDLKLRNLTDEIWMCKNFMRVFCIQRRINKVITIKECADGTSTISDTYDYDPILFGGLKFTFIPRYIPFFKSYDPKKLAYIDSQYLSLSEIQERYMDTKKFVYDAFKIKVLQLISFIKHIPDKFMSVAGGSQSPPDSDNV